MIQLENAMCALILNKWNVKGMAYLKALQKFTEKNRGKERRKRENQSNAGFDIDAHIVSHVLCSTKLAVLGCLAGVSAMLLLVETSCILGALIVHQANVSLCNFCDDDVHFSGRNFICCLILCRCCGYVFSLWRVRITVKNVCASSFT